MSSHEGQISVSSHIVRFGGVIESGDLQLDHEAVSCRTSGGRHPFGKLPSWAREGRFYELCLHENACAKEGAHKITNFIRHNRLAQG